jgi:uncharacterized protein YbjT (DUF2867 family)
MNKTLVTGSTGKVGSVVMDVLARDGVPVIAATRSPQNVAVRSCVEVARFDYADSATYQTVLTDVDRVFLMEPQPAAGPAHMIMIPFAERAIAHGCKIVLLSSASVAFQPEPLGRVEETVLEARDCVILRANWFMDNFHTWWAEEIKYAHKLSLPAGHAATPFIDARDVGAAVAAALQRDEANGKTLVLTGSQALTHVEAAAVLGEAASLTIQYQDVPEQAFAETLSQAGLPSEYVRYIVSLFRLTRQGVFERPTNDLEWLIGRRARTLKEYATDYREAWQ